MLSAIAVLFGGSAKLLIISVGVTPADSLVTNTPDASPAFDSVIVNVSPSKPSLL